MGYFMGSEKLKNPPSCCVSQLSIEIVNMLKLYRRNSFIFTAYQFLGLKLVFDILIVE